MRTQEHSIKIPITTEHKIPITKIRRHKTALVPLPPHDIEKITFEILEKRKQLQIPVDFELGCGAGMHPIRYSQKHGDRIMLAVEHTKKKYHAFESHLRQARKELSLENLFPIHGNAISILSHLIPSNSIHRFFLLYPNPNPKARSQRWFTTPVMETILKSLVKDGYIIFSTNLRWYLEEAIYFATKAWFLELISVRPYNKESSCEVTSFEKKILVEHPASHYEKKYLDRGETCFTAIFKKTELAR